MDNDEEDEMDVDIPLSRFEQKVNEDLINNTSLFKFLQNVMQCINDEDIDVRYFDKDTVPTIDLQYQKNIENILFISRTCFSTLKYQIYDTKGYIRDDKNIIWAKDIIVNDPNMIHHLYRWSGYQLKQGNMYKIIYYLSDDEDYDETLTKLLLPFIHAGTLSYLTRVKYSKPPEKFFKFLNLYKRIVNYSDRFHSLIFASMSSSLYGLYQKDSLRPRDLDFWVTNVIKPKIDANTSMLSEDERENVDSYGINVSKNKEYGVGEKRSMTEKFFGYFQMTANSDVNTEYVLPEGKFPQNSKFQVNNTNPGSGPFLIITIGDLILKTENSVFAYGCNFLCLELEIFRKHLRYLDKCTYEINDQEEIVDMCKNMIGFDGLNTIVEKDQADFRKIRELVRSESILPSFHFNSKEQYLKYLGIDVNVRLPIHSYVIYSSVPSKSAYDINYKGKNITEISHPDISKSKDLFNYTNLAFVSFIQTQITLDQYRKTTVGIDYTNTDHNGQSNIYTYYIDTYTKVTDAISGLVYTHQKVFRNVALSEVPRTPIQSIYGDLPSTWLWILTSKGKLDIILVTSGFELINKHIALAYKTNIIVSGGELRVQKNGDIIVNTQSGTYIKNAIGIEIDNSERYKSAVSNYFAMNLGEEWFKDNKLYFTNEEIIPSSTRPRMLELTYMCSGLTLDNRIFERNDELWEQKYFSQQGFDEVVSLESSKKVCDYDEKFLRSFKSVLVSINDIEVTLDLFKNVEYDILQAYADAFITNPSISYSLNLSEYLNLYRNSLDSFMSNIHNYDIIIRSKPNKSRSASPSYVYLGKIKFNNIGLKSYEGIVYNNYISIKTSPHKSSGLLYEVKVYNYLTENLVKTHATPNIATYIWSRKDFGNITLTRDLKESLDDKDVRKRIKDPNVLKWIDNEYNNKINMVVTEWLSGLSLRDFFNKRLQGEIFDFDSFEEVNLLFQLSWTIKCMNSKRAQHNDLHYGNVFISKLKSPTTFTYFISENTYVQIRTKYIIKIYDFDQSYVESLGDNTYIKDFSYMGTQNKINDRFDITTIICYLKDYINPTFLSSLYGPNYKDILRYDKWGFDCRPCKLDKRYVEKVCTEKEQNEYNDGLLTSEELLQKLIKINGVHHISELSDEDYCDNIQDLQYFFDGNMKNTGKGKMFVYPEVNIHQLRNNLTL